MVNFRHSFYDSQHTIPSEIVYIICLQEGRDSKLKHIQDCQDQLWRRVVYLETIVSTLITISLTCC